jgi:hypothetical protein
VRINTNFPDGAGKPRKAIGGQDHPTTRRSAGDNLGDKGASYVVKRYRKKDRKFVSYSFSEGLIEQGIVIKDGRRYRTSRDRVADNIVQTVKVAAKVISSKGSCFHVVKGACRARVDQTPLGSAIVSCIRQGFFGAHQHFPRYKFSPLFLLMEKHLADLVLPSRGVSLDEVDPLNERVERIRLEGKEKGFKRSLSNHCRSMAENRRNLLEDIAELRRRHSRVTFVRIDTGYGVSLTPTGFQGDTVTYEKARLDRLAFIRFLDRGPFASKILWIAWKQEGALEKGHHTHYLIAFCGRRVRKDAAVAYLLCKEWTEVIAPGNGVAHNCNANKSRRYRRVAVGRLHRDDEVGYRALIELVVPYMTKMDEFLRFDPEGAKVRTFGRSELKPRVTRSHGGAGPSGAKKPPGQRRGAPS